MHAVRKKEWNNPPVHFTHRRINGAIEAKNVEREGRCDQPDLDDSHNDDAVPYQIES